MNQAVVELFPIDVAQEEINNFLNNRKMQSENTYKTYRSDLNVLFKRLLGKELKWVNVNDLNSISHDQIEKYIIGEYEDGVKTKSINKRIVVLRELMRYLVFKEVVNNKVVVALENVTRLKEKDCEHTDPFTTDEVLKIAFLALNEKRAAAEKRFLFLLGLDTGIRLDALLKIKWSYFIKEGNKIVLRVTDKGGKSNSYELSQGFYEDLTLNLMIANEDYVFGTLTESKVNTFLKNCLEKMKLTKEQCNRKLSFHSVRKASADYIYEITGDIKQVQKRLGHASINTTQIYLSNRDYGVKGVVSNTDEDDDLYRTVDHHSLLAAIEQLEPSLRMKINMKLRGN